MVNKNRFHCTRRDFSGVSSPPVCRRSIIIIIIIIIIRKHRYSPTQFQARSSHPDGVPNAFSKHFQSVCNNTLPVVVQSMLSKFNDALTSALTNGDNVREVINLLRPVTSVGLNGNTSLVVRLYSGMLVLSPSLLLILL
jgi:hypothetical protein